MIERPDLSEKISPPLKPLLELAGNLRWSWHSPAAAVFERVDASLWESLRHNPVTLLRQVSKERLESLAGDGVFLGLLDTAMGDLERYLQHPAWYATQHADAAQLGVAYFSAEYGIAECLPVYSGGLGILAGDHLRAASDLGVPLVAIGLGYRSGYFRQALDAEGAQTEIYDDFEFDNMPVNRLRHADGTLKTVDVPFPDGHQVRLQIWLAQVGRIPLYLLDSNLPENDPQDREITRYLYGGDQDTRLRQEILLGIGGVRALNLLGIGAQVFHLNEGHSAFLIVERVQEAMQEGLDFETARRRVAATSIFTTHTPEPAGFDHFSPDHLWRYLQPYVQEMGITFERFLSLGTASQPDGYRPLNMALLALRNADYRNGVSRLHGRVARSMWRGEWPHAAEDRIPIGSVTNGVHLENWMSPEMGLVLDDRLGPAWREGEVDLGTWSRVEEIPDEVIWSAHRVAKQRLLESARRRLAECDRRVGRSEDASHVGSIFDPEGLLIGFARRFAPYKRATLLLSDRERLKALLMNPERPVQFIFAGKAHPQNQEGKDLIRTINAFAREMGRHIAFVEEYDIDLARLLVQGVDVWLNTPRRPQEASGTSGMKAAVNGIPNLSVLDGWWAEAYQPEVGWAIGDGEAAVDHAAQDEREARSLYELLENAVVPAFYDRDGDGIPRRWTAMMKASIRILAPVYNTHRMVREYTENYYLEAGKSALVNK
jgi:starch phosphorylase